MAGLSVGQDGRIYKDGAIFRNIGVNHPNAIFPIVTQTNPTGMLYNTEAEIRSNLALLQANGVKVIRCRLFPDLPNQWKYGVNAGKTVSASTATDRAAFYAKVDAFLAICAEYDIGCIMTLFQRVATLPDLCSENVRAWLTAGSATRNFANIITQEVVTKYLNHSQVYAWEISNEVNNYNNKPTPWHAVSVSYGTAASYSAANDNFNDGEWAAVVAWWNGVVKAIDATRPRMTGNGPCQYWKLGGTPTIVSPLNQFYDEFVRDNPANAMSIHYYGNIPYSSDSYRGLEALLVGYRHFARNNGAAFILGEYGMQARKVTSMVNNGNGTATVMLDASNEPLNCDVGDVIDFGYVGDWDGQYSLVSKESATSVTVSGENMPSSSFSGVGYINNLYSKFDRMTHDVLASGVDVACVWTYLTEPWDGHSMESLSDPYNEWMFGVIKSANKLLV